MKQLVFIHEFSECLGRHSHDYPQILVPLKSDMQIQIGDTLYHVSAQELCFIPKGNMHECTYYGRLLAINLSAELFESQDQLLLSSPFVIPMQGQILSLVDLIQSELNQFPNSTSVQHLYNFLYSKLVSHCLYPSIRYINEHYSSRLTVEILSEIENYNITYYNEWFRQKTGITPNQYLRNVRIEKAKELLKNTNLSISKIALSVGYNRVSSFSRAFCSVTTVSPKSYRNSFSLP